MYRHGLLIVLLSFFCVLSATGTLMWDERGLPLVTNDNLDYSGSVITLNDGSAMIVWSKNASGERSIYAMRYGNSGEDMWDSPRIVFTSMEYPVQVEIELLSDGSLMLYWWEYLGYESVTAKVLKINDEGTPLWQQPLVVGDMNGEWSIGNHCVPDANGGAFITMSLIDFPAFINHVNSEGALDWESGIFTMFNGASPGISRNWSCSDGESGILATARIYSEDAIVVQRITEQGETPWGENGTISFPCSDLVTYPSIFKSGNNQFTILWLHKSNTDYSLDIHRINRDGQILSEATFDLDYDDSYYPHIHHTSCISGDEDGNICFAWAGTLRDDYEYGIVKIAPDNQLLWYQGNGFSTDYQGTVIQRLGLSFGEYGTLYMLSGGSNCNLAIRKFDQNGEALWDAGGKIIADDFDNCCPFVVPVDQSYLIFWSENSFDKTTFRKQLIDCDGMVHWAENGVRIDTGNRQSSFNYSSADSNEPSNRLVYKWSGTDHYFQTIDFEGEYSAPEACVIILDGSYAQNDILAMEQIGDDCVIVGKQSSDYHCIKLCVNRFDPQGNRVWPEDLVVHSIDGYTELPFHHVHMESCQGDILVGWDHDGALMAQKITGGQIAWNEPVTILPSSTSNQRLVEIVDDYFFWEDNQNESYRVIRIADDGTPYEGWNEYGNSVTSLSASKECLYCKPMDEGILVVWQSYTDDYESIYMQTVHEDGTMQWENGCAILTDSTIRCPAMDVSDDILYIFWRTRNEYVYTSDLNGQAFTLNGEPLWDNQILCQEFGAVCDAAATVDGCLVVAYDSYSTENQCGIVMQHVKSDGTLWNDTFYVCDLPGLQVEPQITPAQDNKYFITWEDYRNFVTYDSEIFAQLYQYEPLSTDDPTDIPAWKPNMSVYPNPFNPETNVRFSLCRDSKVDLKVYNVKGQLVRTLCDEVLPLGNHEITWDGTDNAKKSVSSGVYLFNLKINGNDYRSKALLLK